MLTWEWDRLQHFPPDDRIERSAVIRGANDQYRYQLRRVWDATLSACVWIMLNPSTADATVDDATIRKCMRFAFLWGHGSIVVVNLYAYRSRNPRALLTCDDPAGPDNDFFIQEAAYPAGRVVCGWGALPFADRRAVQVPQLLTGRPGRPVECLGLTKKGEPKHPLMLAYVTPLEQFTPREG